MREQVRHSKERNVQLEETILRLDVRHMPSVQLEEMIVQLEKENRQMKEDLENAKNRRSHNKRSYNVRQYKGYPRPKNTGSEKKPKHESAPVTDHKNADLSYCPIHGNTMPASADGYTRVVEDVIDGQWRCTKWSVGRKYYKKQYTPDIPGVLPNEHFGNTIMSQIFAMRSINISYGKIQDHIRPVHKRIHT